MYKIEIENLNKQYIANKNRKFYSICRNIANFDVGDNDKINELIEKIKENYKYDFNGEYYNKIIIYLSSLLSAEKILPEEAIEILINSIDPNFAMFQIYEEESNIKKIKAKIKGIFRFYDDKFLQYEKKYLQQKGLEDKYKWEYKKMD